MNDIYETHIQLTPVCCGKPYSDSTHSPSCVRERERERGEERERERDRDGGREGERVM